MTLTAAQRQNIHLYTVAAAKFHKIHRADRRRRFRQRSGHQRAGALLRSGVAAVGFSRRPGQERRPAGGGGLAGLCSRRQRLSARRSPRPKPTAGLPTWTRICSQHNGVAQREADQAETDAVNAEADRDAALQGARVAERSRPDHQGHSGGAARSARRGHDPLADRGHRGGKTDHPRRAAAGRHHACFTVADLSRVWVMAQIFGSDLASVQRRRLGRGHRPVIGSTQLLRTSGQHLGPGGPRHARGGRARGRRESAATFSRNRCTSAC